VKRNCLEEVSRSVAKTTLERSDDGPKGEVFFKKILKPHNTRTYFINNIFHRRMTRRVRRSRINESKVGGLKLAASSKPDTANTILLGF